MASSIARIVERFPAPMTAWQQGSENKSPELTASHAQRSAREDSGGHDRQIAARRSSRSIHQGGPAPVVPDTLFHSYGQHP